MVVLSQKPRYRLLLPLLLHHPFVVFPQQQLEMLRPFMSVDGVAHLLSYLRRKTIADNCLASFKAIKLLLL